VEDRQAQSGAIAQGQLMRNDLIIIGLLVAAMLGYLSWQTWTPQSTRATIGLADILGGTSEHFRQVTGPEPISFPADHASHPDFQNEWWYFTGNLATPDQRQLGFQFTLFRSGLEPGPERDSLWVADALWMAHLALGDGGQERFFQAERFARDALGLAGANSQDWWLRDWHVTTTDDGWQLQAEDQEFGLDLQLVLTRPIILQGVDGYSRKGPDAGQASLYYSATRLAVFGQVRLQDQWLPVEGLAWLDREWGTGQMPPGLAGWDWFALQLDDERDLMIYRLRKPDGSASDLSAGALVGAHGQARILAASDFETRTRRIWRDADGVNWPLEWQLSVPGENLDLIIRPLFDDQVWHQSVRYWEGAVEILDASTNQHIGRGFMELSGYAEAP
jgi:predicted secreted hydrolase